MGLIDLIVGDRQKAIQDAWDTYVRLLEDNIASPQAADQLKAAMAAIGKTSDDLSRDRQTILQARTLQRTIVDADQADKGRSDAQKRVSESHTSTIQQINKLQAAHQQLVLAASKLEERYIAGQDARQALAKLSESNPAIVNRLK